MPPQQVKQASSSENMISESRENPALGSAPPASPALLSLAVHMHLQVNTTHPLKFTSRDQEQKHGSSFDQLWE